MAALPSNSQPARQQDWSVIVPFYNEADYLRPCLQSILAQSVLSESRAPFRLILVDNASTDGSADLARRILDEYLAPNGLNQRSGQIEAIYLHEARPGKIHALSAGIARIDSQFVALCDADTIYPPDYLAKAQTLIACADKPPHAGRRPIAGAIAFGLSAAPSSPASLFVRFKGLLVASLLPRQCHSGGYGHVFRTDFLLEAGGYDVRKWPFVLEDHEIVHRILKLGAIRYDADFWCQTSNRRQDRTSVNWTLFERLLYHFTPFSRKDWLFYKFLAQRFRQRKMDQTALRDKSAFS